MTPRAKHQPTSGGLPLRSSEPLKATLRSSERSRPRGDALGFSEHDPDALRESERDAARLLDQAFTDAGLETKVIADLCGVSPSLVEKWRSTEARGGPSFLQLLCLPPAFHLAMNKLLNQRYGFGRAALLDLLDAVGRLALLAEE